MSKPEPVEICFHRSGVYREASIDYCAMCGLRLTPIAPKAEAPPKPVIWDNTTVCFGSDCPNCEREKAEAPPALASFLSSVDKLERVVARDAQVTPSKASAAVTPAPPAPKPELPKYSPLENRLTLGGVDVMFPPEPAPPANVSEPPTNQTKPCHPECREVCDCDGGMSPQCTNTVLRHAPACPNAPVSEPPNWDELVRSIAEDPDDFAPAMAKPLDRAYLALKAQIRIDLVRELDALKAQNATLTAELADLKQGIPLTYNPNAMCRNGHEMVLFKTEDEHCPMCALTAEVERLRDLIVKHAVTSGLIAEANAIRAIRAAREAGKS